MRHIRRLVWSSLALVVIFGSGPALAQTIATSFDELRKVVKEGQTVLVITANGERRKGRIGGVSLSPPALEVLAPTPRTFLEPAIAEIRATDGLWNGALFGAGVGLGFALWDYLIDPSEPGNGVIFSVALGLGAAVGAGIDALIGGRVLYRPRQTGRRLTISPLATRAQQGVIVAIRF